ncbi:4313_t:CDS:2, partial [Scutellospora calospora]
AVCKPSIPRERYFYELLEKSHPELLPFIPQYLGVVNVINRTHDGEITPEVVFEQNKHLLPEWMLNRVNSFDNRYGDGCPFFDKVNNKIPSISSAPNLRSSNVNQDLKNEVLQEVFSPNVVRARIKALQKEPVRRRHSMTNVATLRSECKPPENILPLDSPCEKKSRKLSSSSKEISSFDLSSSKDTDFHEICHSGNDYFSSVTPMRKELQTSFSNLTESNSNIKFSHDKITSDMSSNFKKDIDYSKSSSKSKPTLRLQCDTTTSVNNPWSLRCYSLQQSTEKPNNIRQFIILGDLTGGLKYPCVLDLKMGTRQYGIDAKPKKRESQIKKCAATTSKTLGVRICGMQANKYYGRSLNNETFFKSLEDFIHNGKHVLVHHIPVILRKLRRLAKIIRGLSNYRFYGS